MPVRAPLVVLPVRNGRGIVARRAFRPGQLLCRFGGRLLTSDQVWDLWDRDPRRAANCMRFDADRYLSPGRGIGAFANHSCRPNAALLREGPRLVLRAIASVRAGDEVTHDYATFLGADDVWTMRCNCGERGCRRVVKRFDRLPRALLRRYAALDAIPSFIWETAPGLRDRVGC